MATLRFNSIQFCTNGTFLDSIIDILCNTNGIFTVSAKRDIRDIYTRMHRDLNKHQYVIYPLPGNIINNKLDPTLLKDPTTHKFYAGHDLPVWLNDPKKAEHRLLVVSQDPRRNVDEMNNNEIEDIGISTPFGLHSMEWRSDKSKGLIHWVVDKLLKESEFEKSLSVYYTDVYKFRGVDDKSNNIDSTLDKKNSDIYYKIFKKEIELFKPTIVLLMGGDAEKTYCRVRGKSTVDEEDKEDKIVRIPHPSPSANGKWSEVLNPPTVDEEDKEDKIVRIPHPSPSANGKWSEVLNPPTSDNKIDYIYNLLKNKLGGLV